MCLCMCTLSTFFFKGISYISNFYAIFFGVKVHITLQFCLKKIYNIKCVCRVNARKTSNFNSRSLRTKNIFLCHSRMGKRWNFALCNIFPVCVLYVWTWFCCEMKNVILCSLVQMLYRWKVAENKRESWENGKKGFCSFLLM